MYDTAAHVEMVKQRIRQRQYRRAKNQIFALSAICVLLSAVLIGGTAALAGIEQAALPGLYGSMLLREGAGGYVLVARPMFGKIRKLIPALFAQVRCC